MAGCSPGRYAELLAHPERLEAMLLPRKPGLVLLDEIQRLPSLLDEVHRLIERRRWRFALTGSSARRLRLYGGAQRYEVDGIRVIPLGSALPELPAILG